MKKFLPGLCSHCGQSVQLVNPAWLRATRKAHGVTLAKMGERLGCSGVYVHMIETNKKPVPSRVLAVYEALAAVSA